MWLPRWRRVVKNLPTNAEDAGSIPGWGRSPGEGHGNPLQCSCLGNPMDRGAWQSAIHGAAKSHTQLKQLSSHFMNLAGHNNSWAGLWLTMECVITMSLTLRCSTLALHSLWRQSLVWRLILPENWAFFPQHLLTKVSFSGKIQMQSCKRSFF